MGVPSRPAVVLTRGPEANRPLAEALALRGVPVVEVPCVSTEWVEPAGLPEGVAAVTFASPRGVEGLVRIDGWRRLVDGPPRPVVAAVGPTTAAALAARDVVVDSIADPPRGEVLARALVARLPAGSRVATVQGDRTTGDIERVLAEAGCVAVPVVVYRHTGRENPGTDTSFGTKGVSVPGFSPAPAAVFVASPSAGQRFLQLHPELRDRPFVVIGDTTAAALRALGVRDVRVAGTSFDAWVDALCQAGAGAPALHSGDTMNPRPESDRLFQEACRLMPGGVSSPVRAFRSVGGTPVYFRRASGARFRDADDREYLDFCLSWGPLILGHAHPAVVEAVREAAGEGLSFGACCEREVELAGLVLEAFPAMEQVRFTSSGTEAVMTAIRLARGVTGRPRIVKFEGGYHGHSDSLLVKAGSGLVTFGTSSSRGVPESLAAETIVLPFDDEQALEDAFASGGESIAAVIVEPLPANNGLLQQRAEWLRRVRDLCTRFGALLILDEVISGFRLRYGGYGDLVGVPADIVTLGKILGGGMPAAALAGRRDVMQHLAPVGGVYQAGTLSGNPVSLAAGIATLRLLRDGAAYDRLERLGAHLEQALAAQRDRVPFLNWRRVGSILWPYLVPGDVPRTPDAIAPQAVARFNAVHAPLLDRGLYLPPSAYEVLFLSTAHTEADVETLAAGLADELAARADR